MGRRRVRIGPLLLLCSCSAGGSGTLSCVLSVSVAVAIGVRIGSLSPPYLGGRIESILFSVFARASRSVDYFKSEERERERVFVLGPLLPLHLSREIGSILFCLAVCGFVPGNSTL